MGQSFAGIAVFCPLMLLAACFQVAPRSSVPFQASADRQTRYAAETMLAIKEDRRREISEAAANGRMVLPQLPEIWGPPGAQPRRARAAVEAGPARQAPSAAQGLAMDGCSSLPEVWPGDASLVACRQQWRGQALLLPPPGYAAIAPGAPPLAP